MDKLDLLIEKFKEAKEELQKSDANTQSEAEIVEKSFISSFSKWGSTKKVKPAATKPKAPTKTLTGIDKIKAAAKETIKPTTVKAKSANPIVDDDRSRAAAMGAPSNATSPNKPPRATGLERIKQVSQQPIVATSTKIKKDEDEESEDLNKARPPLPRGRKDMPAPRPVEGSMASAMRSPGAATAGQSLTSPNDLSQAHMYTNALAGEYQPPVPPRATGLDRIRQVADANQIARPVSPPRATGLDAIRQAGQQAVEPTVVTSSTLPPPRKTGLDRIAQVATPAPLKRSENDVTKGCAEKLSLNKGGQWSLDKGVNTIGGDGTADDSIFKADDDWNPKHGPYDGRHGVKAQAAKKKLDDLSAGPRTPTISRDIYNAQNEWERHDRLHERAKQISSKFGKMDGGDMSVGGGV